MKKWISSLATVVLMATIVISWNNGYLKNLIIPEAEADFSFCDHVLNIVGIVNQNESIAVHTINAIVYPWPGNSGSINYTYTGPGAAALVIDSVVHTSTASVVIDGHNVQISNIPPGGTFNFQVMGTFTSPGFKTIWVLGSDLMNVTVGDVGSNCNSLSGTYSVLAALNRPTISMVPTDYSIVHSDEGGDVFYDYSLSMDDADGITQTSSISMECPAGWSIPAPNPTSGTDTWSSVLRKTYSRNGPVPLESCTVTVTDPEGTNIVPRTATFEATDVPLTITPSFTTCEPGSLPITGNLQNATCTASGTVTFTDPDDPLLPITTSTSALPAGVSITLPLPPSVVPGFSYPVVFSITGTEGGSVNFEGVTSHDSAVGTQYIGQSEEKKIWSLFPEFGVPKRIEIRKKMCVEIAFDKDDKEVGRRPVSPETPDDEDTPTEPASSSPFQRDTGLDSEASFNWRNFLEEPID